jgi:hypothetical protein
MRINKKGLYQEPNTRQRILRRRNQVKGTERRKIPQMCRKTVEITPNYDFGFISRSYIETGEWENENSNCEPLNGREGSCCIKYVRTLR